MMWRSDSKFLILLIYSRTYPASLNTFRKLEWEKCVSKLITVIKQTQQGQHIICIYITGSAAKG
jgi:hypothetical protein